MNEKDIDCNRVFCIFKDTMLFKNLMLFAVVALVSLGFVSCDGGGEENDLIRISLPGDPDGANALNTGELTKAPDPELEATYANLILVGINAQRVEAGLPELILNPEMSVLAADHNAYLISRSQPFSIISVNHDNAQSRADAVVALGFKTYGENTGGVRGYNSGDVAPAFLTGWVRSPGHFANIVGDFTHTGIAVTVDTRDNTVYSTQVFAK